MIGRTNTGGGGGGGLNFQVVGGTTAPSNPKENLIWINTDTKITSWIFSATEPTEATEGMVWVFIGTSSTNEFNALKKNGIQVYPIYAKQHIGGSLVDVTAMSYHNGEWSEWLHYIYNKGDERYSLKITEQHESSVEYTKNADSISVKVSKAGSSNLVHGVYIEIGEKIDFTPYKTMKCVASKDTLKGGSCVLFVTQGTAADSTVVSKAISQASMVWETENTDHVCSLDVSGIDVAAYPIVRLYASGNTSNAVNYVFKQWWLE